MPLYEVTADQLKRIEETSFHEARIRERADLQRLLRSQIEIVIPDALVIAEEFGEWEESRRRIDLLAIDKDANLVVIELKRTEDGGHMELQALRYAAMVSTMTFDNAVTVYGEYLKRRGREVDPQQELLDFLEWDEKNEEHFAQDVRIILVSAEFSKELTGSVLWLNSYGLDIRCVRIKPYSDNGRILIDVQQVIPLPEANEYQIQLREKEQVGRKKRAERHDLRLKFWEGLVAQARKLNTRHAHIKPGTYHWIDIEVVHFRSIIWSQLSPRLEATSATKTYTQH